MLCYSEMKFKITILQSANIKQVKISTGNLQEIINNF
jgi:hypothetical protein